MSNERKLTPELVAIEIQGVIDEYKKWGYTFEPAWVYGTQSLMVNHGDFFDEQGVVDL